MNWLTNFVKPKIQALMRKSEVPDNLWMKCTSCGHMLFHRDLIENLSVCHHCGGHMRIDVKQRLALLFDNGAYTLVPLAKVIADPLKFRDSKRYTDRLKEARTKTAQEDALLVAYGQVGGQPLVVAAFNFNFMGGSMGMAVGEAILTGAEMAVRSNCAYLIITASGGARMQEGILSLMQMPRTIIAIEKVKRAGLPYITLLTDPTSGGVSASFAMLGDISIAEPGAIICFAGARVIEETIRQKLPEGFQRAEYLLEHGMVDMVIPRKDLPREIAKILRHLKSGTNAVRR